MTTDREEFHRDILDGLAKYFDSPFAADILATVSRYSEPDLGNALNRNQMASKLWLADCLRHAAGREYATVTVLGGWFGVLGAILLHDRNLAIEQVVSIDIDPRCKPVAESINATHVRAGRFVAVTGDMLEWPYRLGVGRGAGPDLLINTSCEHISRFDAWYSSIPERALMVLQSNDYYTVAQHVNCVPDLAAFRAQAPMREELFAGTREQKKYRRFMLIGRK